MTTLLLLAAIPTVVVLGSLILRASAWVCLAVAMHQGLTPKSVLLVATAVLLWVLGHLWFYGRHGIWRSRLIHRLTINYSDRQSR